MESIHWALLTCVFLFMSCQVYLLILLSFFLLFIFETRFYFFLTVVLCNSVAGNWMLWFLLVMFLLHYCTTFKPTWRKSTFSCREFKLKNKNRTIVIGSEESRDCKSDAEDISVLLSTRGPERNSWSQRQVECVLIYVHTVYGGSTCNGYIYFFFLQLIGFEIVHTSPSEWHSWSMKPSVCETWWHGGSLRGQCPLVVWNGCSGEREQNWCRCVHAAFQECSLNCSRRWAVLGLALGLAVHQSWGTCSACGLSRCQYGVHSLALSYLAEQLYQGSLSKTENEIRSLFLSETATFNQKGSM